MARRRPQETGDGKAPRVAPQPDELEVLSSVFTDRLGRDSVVDLVRNRLSDKNEFLEMVRAALYTTRGAVELKPLQYELVAAVGDSKPYRILTTNFDNLLERAFCKLYGLTGPKEVKEKLAIVVGEGQFEEKKTEFIHLHGFLPPESDTGEGLVLSEQDFWKTRDNWATDTLRNTLMEPDRDLLVVGMSLADPRLRRVLFERAESDENNGDVYVLLDKQTASLDKPLARRRAFELLGVYERQYWEDLGVNVRFVENFELLPLYLRQIRLGNTPGQWCDTARSFLRKRVRQGACCYDQLHSVAVQQEARYYLAEQLEFIRRKFEVPHDEELTLGFFVPSKRVGVGFLSSNRRTPFWTGFSSDRSLNLNTLIRASFRELLGYQKS